MIKYKSIRETIVEGLKGYLGCEVVLANQTVPMPEYPYVSFTVTTPKGANQGTYGYYADGIYRKPIKQIWSITVQSATPDEATELADKAHDYFGCLSKDYLQKNDIVVEKVGDITNRDNLLTYQYEYRSGFDITFVIMDELEIPEDSITYSDIKTDYKIT